MYESNPWIIPLLKSERDLHITAARRCRENAARDAQSGISPVMSALDADKHTFAANVLNRILESCGEK